MEGPNFGNTLAKAVDVRLALMFIKTLVMIAEVTPEPSICSFPIVIPNRLKPSFPWHMWKPSVPIG
jgi:hypothetical protein